MSKTLPVFVETRVCEKLQFNSTSDSRLEKLKKYIYDDYIEIRMSNIVYREIISHISRKILDIKSGMKKVQSDFFRNFTEKNSEERLKFEAVIKSHLKDAEKNDSNNSKSF